MGFQDTTFWTPLAASNSQWIFDAVYICVSFGFISMVIIQLFKNFIRRKITSFSLIIWIDGLKDTFATKLRGFFTTFLAAEDELAELAKYTTAGNVSALIGLPVEQLCGQVNSASQRLLDYPDDNPEILRKFLGPNPTYDVIAAFDSLKEHHQNHKKTNSDSSADEISDARLVDARNRVQHQIQRNIDSLQIQLKIRWKNVLGFICFLLSLLLISIATDFAENAGSVAFWMAVAGTTYAGMLWRDVIALLEKLRG